MTLLGKAGIKDDLKKEMVYNFTNGRTESVRDLTPNELKKFCNELSNKCQSADQELIMKRMRSTVLDLATKTGIKEPNSWEKFNSWMKSTSILKKELHAYTLEELTALIKQFRGLNSNFERSAQKTGTKAWYQQNNIPQPGIN